MVKNLIGQDIVDVVLIIDQNWNQQDLFCERKKRESTRCICKDVKVMSRMSRMSLVCKGCQRAPTEGMSRSGQKW